MASRPPVWLPECPYGLIRPRCRHGRLKIKSIKVSQTWKGKTTYRGHAQATQPPRNLSQCLNGVVGPWSQCGHIKIKSTKLKIEHVNNKRGKNRERTYLGHTGIMQPCWNSLKCHWDIHRSSCQHVPIKITSVNIKIERINNKRVPEDGNTYQICASTTQLPPSASKRLHRVHRPRHQCGRIKFVPINVNWTERNRNAYLGRVNAIQPIWRPGKQIRRVSKLTFGSRKPGEPWCDVNDYGWSLCKLQAVQRYQRNATYQIRQQCGCHAQSTNLPITSLIFYLNQTHSFATIYYWF